MSSEPINEVLDRLDAVEQTGSGEYTARCPAHDDHSPSLSVARGDHQPVVLNCHAGCDPESIVSALGLEWAHICEDGITEEQFESAPWKHGEEAAAYEYQDADGAHVYTVRRYEHSEHGWKSFRPYLPGKQRAGLGKQKRVLYRLPNVIGQAKEGRVVFVVEGEKDVDSLEERGFTATTSGSTSSWKDRYSDRLSGACVVLIPDNDEPGMKYAQEVAESCHEDAKWVRIVELEDVPADGGDVTDWFARGHTKGELESRVDEADSWQPNQVAETTDKADSPDPWSKICGVYQDDRKKARLFAAEQVISDLHVVTHRDSGQCYVWDSDEKVLDAGGEQRIGEMLVRKLGTSHSQHEQKEITEKVRLLTAEDELGGEFIPVANGDLFVDGNTVRLEDADPDRAPLTRSDARWDPNAEYKCFRGHLEGVMPSDRERETLQEYAGYCLLHWDIPFHKALFMVGPTASGKSTTLSAIRKLFGSVSKLSPQQLVNGRFGPAELEGAWANIRSDISAALLQDIGLFKEVVAGDPIFVERKYEQGYNLHPTAKHMYSANRLPEVSIDDDAFYRRILLVSFPTTIPRSERVNRSELDRRLEEELDGILQWAIEGLQRVLNQNGFTHDLSPSETRHRWEEHASSIGRFKAAVLDVTGDSSDVEPKDRVHSVYSQFCQDHGLSTETKRELTRMLKRDPRITDGHRTPTGHSGQVRSYIGAKIDENAV